MATSEPRAPGPPALPDVLPVLPLRRTVVFPHTVSPLAVGQPRSVRLVDDVMRRDRLVALFTQRNETTEQPGPADLHALGTAAQILQLARLPDGTLRVVVQGIERVRLGDAVQTEPYLAARIAPAPERIASQTDAEARRRAVLDVFRTLVGLVADVPEEMAAAGESLPDPRDVAYLVATVVPLDAGVRREILELEPVEAKLRRLVELLQREVAVRELGRRITDETRERLTKSQRDLFLREQLRSIQKELGEEEDGATAELRRRIAEAGLPEEAAREAERELDRLATTPAASPEHGMIRTWLEWMAALPWRKATGEAVDVARTRRVLDEDHYDLDKVKDRIVEYLAVRKLRQERGVEAGAGHEPILCFVGPPGVGKTSLGQSIARALGRRFVRMSLGGVRDEAEIRGHRRTYIGAMPGRIVQGIRRAETRDPVFMLDEIDKVGADWRGDPSAALLEVLDPAQNHTFVDNYLGLAFDLSQVLFIATANTLETIPAPLLDRMEILRLAGYTEEEKVRIAERWLLPKERAANGLRDDELRVDPDALRRIVREYTREAGVRDLDRQLAAIARKVALGLAEGRGTPAALGAADVPAWLGRPRFHDEVPERTDRPGVATGLAWTPTGGDVLFVEATMMPSRNERLVLTGMLGEIMRESAEAALSFVRSDAARLGLDPAVFDGKAVHVHVPAGAIPKDGPSAGVTIATALASLASGRPVRSDGAMTGEITLRGKVLPVGGIKEKVLAAHRAGIRRVILPRRNEPDLEDVPPELRRDIEITLVDTAEEALAQALVPAEGRERPARPDGEGRPAAGA
ncbi:MAG TPA: endopeptidase La [Candidatus Binatia bacterium]|nr:endopeptidase La [Candidatus Binatia bacterium]